MTSTVAPARQEMADRSSSSPPYSPFSAAPLRTAIWFSSILVLVAVVVGIVGGFMPEIFHDAAVTVGNARGTSLVVLVVAVPALIVSMIRAAAGSRRARIVWLGTLAYLVYNATIFAFGTVFNALFLAYAAMLSLAVWSLVALLRIVDVHEMASWFAPRFPARSIGGYLIFTGIAFTALWLADALPAIVANDVPASIRGTLFITNPIQVIDFGFTLPLCVVGGVWLWRRRPLGYLVAGVMLTMLIIENVGIATDQWFGHLHDPRQPLGTVLLFIVLSVVNLVPTIMFLRNVDGPGV